MRWQHGVAPAIPIANLTWKPLAQEARDSVSSTIHNESMNFTQSESTYKSLQPAALPNDRSWRIALLLVATVATAIVAPMIFLGNASGHDFQFHLASWIDVAGQWREGVIYPRWAEWANWGFGEPRFIFYPPASWMLGAALGSVLPWAAVPGTYIWLVLVGGGMAMWRFSREWLSGNELVAASVFFAANPYNIVLVYYRSDFSEMLACAIFPLFLLGIVWVIRDGWSGMPWVAVTFAAIWLSNAPAGVIATYSLALLLVIGCIWRRSLRAMIPGVCGMVAGFGLVAFYILPAAWEQRWVQIGEVVSANLNPEHNFLFTHSDDPEFLLFNWKVSAVAMLVMLVVGIAAVFVARRRRELGFVWWMLLALAGACVFLMFPPSVLLWRHLPKLRYLQFPWRWLGPLDVVFASFTAAALGRSRKQLAFRLAILAILTMLAITIASNAWWDSADVPQMVDMVQAGHGYQGTDEYAPAGCNPYDLPGEVTEDTDVSDAPPPTPSVEMLDDNSGDVVPATGVKIQIAKWTAERRTFAAEASTPVTLALRLVNYPAWDVRIDGVIAKPDSQDRTAQMLLPLPSGTHRVEIHFRRTPDRILGAGISLFAVVALLAFVTIRRRFRPRLGAPPPESTW